MSYQEYIHMLKDEELIKAYEDIEKLQRFKRLSPDSPLNAIHAILEHGQRNTGDGLVDAIQCIRSEMAKRYYLKIKGV